jgi:hypothetical protein
MSKAPSSQSANRSEGQSAERKKGSGVKMVYDVLRDEIIDLSLAPGSPIDENQLAERFAMSRTPIREALVRLASDGFVTTLPNRSTVVSNIDFLSLPAFFDATCCASPHQSRPQDHSRPSGRFCQGRARPECAGHDLDQPRFSRSDRRSRAQPVLYEFFRAPSR